jgi:hypothetical protein
MKNYKIKFLILFLVAITGHSLGQTIPFVPAEFNVPTVFENKYLRIRPLTVNDVVKDYDAVMSSLDHLQGVFGPNSAWPSPDLSFEQDLIDLGWHQKEFQIRSSFAYTVVTLDEKRVIGCIYIFPTSKGDYDASITMWVRADVVEDGYDTILFNTVKGWVSKDWPYKKPAYPGRTITWEQWSSL